MVGKFALDAPLMLLLQTQAVNSVLWASDVLFLEITCIIDLHVAAILSPVLLPLELISRCDEDQFRLS